MPERQVRADLVSALRSYQIHYSSQRKLLLPVHRFVERSIDEFWSYEEEIGTFVYPTVRFDPELKGLAMYESTNPFGVSCGIVLAVRPGMDMRRMLIAVVHEMIHLWEDRVGELQGGNFHSALFHDQMFERYGLRTNGPDGRYCGHDERWDEWTNRNEDLGFDRIVIA